jgi:dihydrofolate reductase
LALGAGRSQDDLGWSVPSDELFQWWSDRVAATGLALYGRKLWETMSSHWPTADQQPGATPAEIEFARRWRDMPKVVFSSTTSTVDWNTRLVTGDAVTARTPTPSPTRSTKWHRPS